MGAPSGTLTFDIETHSAHLLYTMPPEKFFRLGGYRWQGDDEVIITDDLEELRDAIRRARWVVGFNEWDFDLKAVFGPGSNEPVKLAMEGRGVDLMIHAGLVHPTPEKWTDRKGALRVAPKKGWKPEQMMPWFSLDEQAHQLGVGGKTDDLKKLASEFVEPGEDPRLGFGRIPLDDPRYRSYLVGDVEATERVAAALLKRGKLSGNGERYPDRDYVGYPMREQEIAARKAVISSNGWRVDIPEATLRRDELAARRDVIVGKLAADYGLPTDSDNPWSTSEGKRAIVGALADVGITPAAVDWPKTDGWENRDRDRAAAEAKAMGLKIAVDGWWEELYSGIAANGKKLSKSQRAARERWIARDTEKAEQLDREPLPPFYGLSLAGETLIELTKGTPAEDLGVALAEVKGQRSLAQLTLDSVHPDGRVHPEITMLQASGRWSTTKPGLTVWTARGPGAVERKYYLPDTDDEVLVSVDLSNADARGVAAESGDKAYAVRFQPGEDGHLLNAIAAWGADVVLENEETKKHYRQAGKPYGHGWTYGGGPKTLAAHAGGSVEEATKFCDGMAAAFKRLVAWQEEQRKFARRHGYVVNDWGRRMRVEKGREYTQAPALMGQNVTREIMCDLLLSFPLPVLRRVKAQIHDEFVFSIPRKNAEKHQAWLVAAMSTSFEPKHGRGQRIEFPASSGALGNNWYECEH
ncbi:DNA polymerase [Amycolatopsis sp. NPDC004772]